MVKKRDYIELISVWQAVELMALITVEGGKKWKKINISNGF